MEDITAQHYRTHNPVSTHQFIKHYTERNKHGTPAETELWKNDAAQKLYEGRTNNIQREIVTASVCLKRSDMQKLSNVPETFHWCQRKCILGESTEGTLTISSDFKPFPDHRVTLWILKPQFSLNYIRRTTTKFNTVITSRMFLTVCKLPK